MSDATIEEDAQRELDNEREFYEGEISAQGCSCAPLAVGLRNITVQNWNPDCSVHAGLHHDHLNTGYDRHCAKCKSEKRAGK